MDPAEKYTAQDRSDDTRCRPDRLIDTEDLALCLFSRTFRYDRAERRENQRKAKVEDVISPYVDWKCI
jgi:hypothetical protein